MRLISLFRNRNIIAYKEAFFDETSNSLCVVMEYADGGDLYNKILYHKKMQTEF
jgi:NIMA (never in mitosis gene a)-related kinase 1/4/5